MEHKKTVIIGGGIAGIMCALKLQEASEPFVLITEHLAGRIFYSDEGRVNLGAYFIMSNYHNVKKVLKKGSLINKISAQYHNSENDFYTMFRLKTLKLIPQFARFARALIVFRSHFEKYKKNCEIMPIREALEKDEYIHDLFFRSAESFISSLN